MKRLILCCLAAGAVALLAGCAADKPTDPRQERLLAWQQTLETYHQQIRQVRAETDHVKDLREIYGAGAGTVSGDGTFIGEGTGTATLAGIGVVTGTVDGTLLIKGTEDIDLDGFTYLGRNGDYELFSGSGHFTATSDVHQRIEVIVAGGSRVIGAGTGIVFWSGEGMVFWYS